MERVLTIDNDLLSIRMDFGAQISRREALAELLTDDDVETLRHLATSGIGDNSLRAPASDLGYLEAWCVAATGAPLPCLKLNQPHEDDGG